MSFRSETWLWLLALMPIVAAMPIASWVMRRRALDRFGTSDVARAMVIGQSRRLRAARATLLVIGIGLAMVALAGPRWGSHSRMLRKRGVDVVVALDFSKSMLARDVRPSRIDRAKAEVLRMVQELDGDRVGVVAFAGETMEFPLTVDYGAVELFFRDLGPYDMPVGGTAIGRALMSAGALLERSQSPGAARSRSMVVVLMTDGEDHEGDPVAAAQALREKGVRVYTVGIGTRTGEPIPTYSPDGTWTGYMRDDAGAPVTTSLTAENEATLRRVAEATGGKYFKAERGGVGLHAVRRELRALKQAELKARRVTVHEERYALALLPAFLLLVLEGLLPDAWLGRRRRARPARTTTGATR